MLEIIFSGYASKNKLHQVQLGEEMDSKLLLGSYKCTDVPGEFIWQPGVLTKVNFCNIRFTIVNFCYSNHHFGRLLLMEIGCYLRISIQQQMT